jgi:hypothetical protein
MQCFTLAGSSQVSVLVCRDCAYPEGIDPNYHQLGQQEVKIKGIGKA